VILWLKRFIIKCAGEIGKGVGGGDLELLASINKKELTNKIEKTK